MIGGTRAAWCAVKFTKWSSCRSSDLFRFLYLLVFFLERNRRGKGRGREVAVYPEPNHSAKLSQLRCLESFPLWGRQRRPPTLTVRVPSLRRFFFHFSQTSNFTPGLPTARC